MSELTVYLIGFVAFLVFVYKIVRVMTPKNDLMDAVDTSLRFAYKELREAAFAGDDLHRKWCMNQIEGLNKALEEATKGADFHGEQL